jgi:hypothetical protein
LKSRIENLSFVSGGPEISGSGTRTPELLLIPPGHRVEFLGQGGKNAECVSDRDVNGLSDEQRNTDLPGSNIGRRCRMARYGDFLF